VLRLAARVLVGTLVFTLIVVFAGAWPSAAGLMLTFPALNGFAYYFSPPESIAPMTRTMLWMPVVNGALCALYLWLFLLLAPRVAPELLALVLIGPVAGLWLVAITPQFVRAGVKVGHQLPFCVAATVIGALLVAAAVSTSGAPGIAPSPMGAWDFFAAVAHNKTKIVLFALCLAVFLVASTYGRVPDWARGILGSLPLVPFGGLLGVAADAHLSLEQRLVIFRAMAVSIWLAPAVAIWFIYGVARVLASRRPTGSATVDDLVRFSVIAFGWLACLCAILAIAYGIQLGATPR
jgi:hypothetical protein